MATDVHAAAEFYASARGAVVARLLRRRLAELWPALGGMTVLGLGYATPYLRLWRDQAARCFAVMPSQMGATRWPAGAPSLSCVAEEGALPFPDLSIDRVLLVHGLENAEHARRLLREVWRVMTDHGRLLVVAPNRMGMWAHLETTPFGQGQPYSPGQIERLLTAGMFRVERRDTALFMPPVRTRLVLRGAPLWDRMGRTLAPQFAGVTITEAEKDAYAAIPLKKNPSRRLILADAA